MEDPRFCEPTEQLYGEDALGIVSDANRYVGHTRWHPDHLVDPTEDCYGVKFAYYLEPVGAETGALRANSRIAQESACTVRCEKIWTTTNLIFASVPAYVCESEPGDVVAFDVRCWHASWGGAIDRRMCTVVYYKNPEGSRRGVGCNRRKRAANSVKEPNNSGLPFETHRGYHGLLWLRIMRAGARRQRWIDRERELGFLDYL